MFLFSKKKKEIEEIKNKFENKTEKNLKFQGSSINLNPSEVISNIWFPLYSGLPES